MSNFISSCICPVVLLLLCAIPAKADVIVSGLQCEYLTDPLGIDVEAPRLTWKLSDTNHTRGQKQTGYQVLVASSPNRLKEGPADIWDSGVVRSAQSSLVPIVGKKLTSGEDCFWKVRVLDKDSQPSAW
ncbi:MAG TPA: alfa-L-rhamnosidase, partial [Pirellulales bacterium]